MHGRHRPRGRRLRAPLAVGAFAVLAAGGGLAVRAVAGSGDGCDNGVPLSVAVAPELAPAVSEVAARWSRIHPRVAGRCVRVLVNGAAPADVAGAIAARAGVRMPTGGSPAPTPDESAVPAVWVPDSTAWLVRVRSINRAAFDEQAPSVAMSPIVLGVGDQALGSLPGGGKRALSTADLAALVGQLGAGGPAAGGSGSPGSSGPAAGSAGAASQSASAASSARAAGGSGAAAGSGPAAGRMGLVEPRADSAGLIGALLLHRVLAPDSRQLPALVAAYRGLATAPDRASLLRSYRTGTILAPLAEQAVVAHAQSGPGAPVTAVPLAEPASLDYPYAVLGGQPAAVAEAAQLFRAALAQPQHRDLFATRGFRAPDGTAGPGFLAVRGVTAGPASPRPLTAEAPIRDTLNVWTGAVAPSRLLTLFDVTSSMRAGGKLDLLRTAATDGLELFGDASEIGLWAFADGLGNRGEPYRQVVSLNSLSAGQRAALRQAIAGTATAATDVSGLYETVLAAYREVQAQYRPDASNTIVVFTDGANSRPGRNLTDTLRELERLTDVTRPIRVVLIGVGVGVNLPELTEIARVTGGKAFQITDPAQVNSIFLRALLRV